jgi:hypothetical protein
MKEKKQRKLTSASSKIRGWSLRPEAHTSYEPISVETPSFELRSDSTEEAKHAKRQR